MSEITCPTCEGEKYFDRMTSLSYEGDSSWTQDPCDTCNGDGWIEDKQGDEWLATLNKANETLLTIYEPDASAYDRKLGELLIQIDELLDDALTIIKNKRIGE